MRRGMSAFGGEADMPFALHMSASDPKRTSDTALAVVWKLAHLDEMSAPIN
jgi:hypothetical protein